MDHENGTLTARAGAAADIRMPNANAARPGAERRAKEAANVRLRQALATLLGKSAGAVPPAAIERAIESASTTQVEYQSNGGVYLWRRLSFSDLAGGKGATPESVTVYVPAMPARLVPTMVVGDNKAIPAYVLYRRGTPGKGVGTAKWDPRTESLSLPAKSIPVEKANGAVVVIYVGKLES